MSNRHVLVFDWAGRATLHERHFLCCARGYGLADTTPNVTNFSLSIVGSLLLFDLEIKRYSFVDVSGLLFL